VQDAFIDALVQSAFQVTSVLTRIGAENDLSLTQLRVLGILRDRRPRVTELAAHLGLEKSSVSGLVDRAEQRGLMAREKNSEDRRAVDVFLTPAGRELAVRLFSEVRTALGPTLGALGTERQIRLIELLEPTLDV